LRSSGAPRTTLRGPVKALGERGLREVAARLRRWEVLPSGTLGYNKAEVTLGGVDTRRLSSKTMAALDVPGLFFIGEAVDVTGWLGGYNFQWAWASGTRPAPRLDPTTKYNLRLCRSPKGAFPCCAVLRSCCCSSPLLRSRTRRSRWPHGLRDRTTTAIGIPQKNTGELLPRKIGDATVEYIQLDDGGDTTRAVQNIKKLIQENNIDAMIGPSTTPNAFADPRCHRRRQGPGHGDRGNVIGGRAARRQEALGVQDDAER
jgi:hypothetical protein